MQFIPSHRVTFWLSHGAPIPVKRNVRHACDMAREDPQFRIRLPAELKARVEGAAAENQRSLNAEIVHRLESSFHFSALISSAGIEFAERLAQMLNRAVDEKGGRIKISFEGRNAEAETPENG